MFRSTIGVVALSVVVQRLGAQDQCQCNAPGAESSRIASAIGGGLFAGLIAAVIPFHHAARVVAATPSGAGATPDSLTKGSDSTDIAAAPLGAAHERPGAAPAAPAPSIQLAAAGSLPTLTPREAEADGMIAPRTATLLPALAMVGVGAMLLGIFFLRVRRPNRRSY